MKNISISRRLFLGKSMALGTSLLVGCSTSGIRLLHVGEMEKGDNHDIDAWLHLAVDGTVTYRCPSSEMGQGALTGLAMIVAEELDADWNNFKTEFAPLGSGFANPMWMSQNTGGSGSISGYWEPMRKLGASTRQLLLSAAAKKWNVRVDECKTASGWVIHNSGKRLNYGELAVAAAQLDIPKEVALKDPKDFKLIGKPIPRLDTPIKVNGTAVYGIDVQIPNLHIASLMLSPTVGGDVESYDEEAALKIKGVKAIVRIPKNVAIEQQPAGVAVVASSYPVAMKALQALNVKWDAGKHQNLNSESIAGQMRSELDKMEKPDLKDFKNQIDVEYSVPYLSHCPLEPMNATAHVTDDLCQIWAPCQNQTIAASFAKTLTQMADHQIKLETTYLGGGFGRRLEADYVAFAVYVSQQSKVPVKLIWSREEDIKHDYYRPPSVARFQIGLNEQGFPKLWNAQLTAPPLMGRFLRNLFPITKYLPIDTLVGDEYAAPGMTKSRLDLTPFPYPVEDFNIDIELSDIPIPTGNLRAVGHSYTGFFVESAIDEAAVLVKKDPYLYRRELLKNQKDHLAVLDRVAKEANWGKPPKGRSQGIAVFHANGSFIAQVAEVSVDQSKKVKVHKVTVAFDCGTAVNPDLVRSQCEGGIFWAMGGFFTEEITFTNGKVDQNNFYDYIVLKTKDMPQVDVHIMESSKHPTGVGEPPVAPLPAAIANAIYAATGERLRDLPISKSGYTI